MKARLVTFFILGLFLLSLASFSLGAEQPIKLSVTVATNIHAYFDGQKMMAESNDIQPAVIIEDNTTKTFIIFPAP
jgi:hypothetical protein